MSFYSPVGGQLVPEFLTSFHVIQSSAGGAAWGLMLTSHPTSASSSVFRETGRLGVRELGSHIPLLFDCVLHFEVTAAQGLTEKVVSLLLSLLILPCQSLTRASYQSLSPPLFFPFSPPHCRTICLMPNFSPSLSSLSAFLGSKQSGLGNGEGLKTGSFADRLTFDFWGLKEPQTRWFRMTQMYCFTAAKARNPESEASAEPYFLGRHQPSWLLVILWLAAAWFLSFSVVSLYSCLCSSCSFVRAPVIYDEWPPPPYSHLR